MRVKMVFALLALGGVIVMLTDHRTVSAQAPIKVVWSVSTDPLTKRWVATATAGFVGEVFPAHTQLELEWPLDFPTQNFCMDTFYLSSVFPQSSPVSYALIDHVEVRGGGPPLTVRRVCYRGTRPQVYIESAGDNSLTYHLTLAGDLL